MFEYFCVYKLENILPLKCTFSVNISITKSQLVLLNTYTSSVLSNTHTHHTIVIHSSITRSIMLSSTGKIKTTIAGIL